MTDKEKKFIENLIKPKQVGKRYIVLTSDIKLLEDKRNKRKVK